MTDMTDEQAREVLKHHASAFGDSKYEPARWVIDALQAAVAAERERCAKVCLSLWDLRDDDRARMHAAKCAAAILKA